MKDLYLAHALPLHADKAAFINFQSEIGDAPDVNRFYLEYLAMTNQVNRNGFQVIDAALEMLAAGYRQGLPLTINHDKGQFTDSLGIGQTVAAEVRNGNLYVRMYIAKNKTYNTRHLGSSEELIAGILDGYIKNGSTSIRVKKGVCSVCEREVDQWGCPLHHKGEKMFVENDEGIKELVVPYVIIHEAEAIEFSITMLGADPQAKVTEKNLNMSLDNFHSESSLLKLFKTPNADNSAGAGSDPLPPAKKEEEEKTNDLRSSVFPPENSMTEEEIKALQAQLNAEKARADANQGTIDLLNSQLEQRDATIKALTEEAVTNAVKIKDGETARAIGIDNYMKEYAAFVGDTYTPEQEDAQRKLIADMSLEVLQNKTESMREHNKKLYPSGREFGEGEGISDEANPDFV